jgi:D-aminopeptidase
MILKGVFERLTPHKIHYSEIHCNKSSMSFFGVPKILVHADEEFMEELSEILEIMGLLR